MPNSLESSRIAENQVMNSFTNAGHHVAKAGKLSQMRKVKSTNWPGNITLPGYLDNSSLVHWLSKLAGVQEILFKVPTHTFVPEALHTEKWYVHQRRLCSSFHNLKPEMRSFIAFYYFSLSRNK